MNRIPTLFAGLLAVATCSAAPDLGKLPAASDKKGLTYAKDIKPIFEASCFRCHGDRQHKGGLRLDTLEAALKGGEDGKVITAGDSKNSPLVIAVAQIDPENVMPPKPRGGRGGFGGGGPGGPRASGTNAPAGGGGQRPGGPGGPGGMSKPLTAEQVGLIRAWIDQGAK